MFPCPEDRALSSAQKPHGYLEYEDYAISILMDPLISHNTTN